MRMFNQGIIDLTNQCTHHDDKMMVDVKMTCHIIFNNPALGYVHFGP
jgi:hypothetical protein